MAFRYFCQGKHGVFAMVILTIPGGPSMDPFGHFWLQRSATKIEKLMRVKFDAMDDIFLKIYASYTSYIHDFVANLDDVVTCHATKRLMHPFEVFVVGKHLCKNHHRHVIRKWQKQRDGCSMVLGGTWRGTKGAPALGTC